MTAYLLDTNVVLRLVDRSDPVHVQCRQAVDPAAALEQITLVPQVLSSARRVWYSRWLRRITSSM